MSNFKYNFIKEGVEEMTYKTERQLRVCIGIAFWGGMGLMSLINALQLTNGSPIRYGWVMFGISIILIIVGIIILIKRKRVDKIS